MRRVVVAVPGLAIAAPFVPTRHTATGDQMSIVPETGEKSRSDLRVRVVRSFVTVEPVIMMVERRAEVAPSGVHVRRRLGHTSTPERRSLWARLFLGKGAHRPTPFPHPQD